MYRCVIMPPTVKSVHWSASQIIPRRTSRKKYMKLQVPTSLYRYMFRLLNRPGFIFSLASVCFWRRISLGLCFSFLSLIIYGFDNAQRILHIFSPQIILQQPGLAGDWNQIHKQLTGKLFLREHNEYCSERTSLFSRPSYLRQQRCVETRRWGRPQIHQGLW